jgi:hypothetical protein
MHPPGQDTEDAVSWWQAYQLADSDQVDELRERAAAGDEHARQQLASWLADRGRTDEAISVIRPLADSGDDVADLWLARWLADGEHLDELRQRASAGSYHAVHELARWLAYRDRLEELRELAVQRLLPLGWLAAQSNMNIVRLAADLGDDQAREHLERWLGRMRERSRDGDERARRVLAEWPDGEVLVSGK